MHKVLSNHKFLETSINCPLYLHQRLPYQGIIIFPSWLQEDIHAKKSKPWEDVHNSYTRDKCQNVYAADRAFQVLRLRALCPIFFKPVSCTKEQVLPQFTLQSMEKPKQSPHRTLPEMRGNATQKNKEFNKSMMWIQWLGKRHCRKLQGGPLLVLNGVMGPLLPKLALEAKRTPNSSQFSTILWLIKLNQENTWK